MKTENNKLMKLLSAGLCFTMITGLVACGGNDYETAEETETVETTADAGVMDNWDQDRFRTTFASDRRYADWDANDDDLLDENEFYVAHYSTWDVNNDNRLDENEWNTATRDFAVENQNWTDWDTNRDNTLDENEFRTGFANTNYYRDWDRDGDRMINEQEYSEGVFGTWDRNQDGMLDNNEYSERYNRYYGNAGR